MTLLARDTSGIHHDVTWLIGALARGLMERARNPGVLDMLGRLSACDFSPQRLTGAAPATVAACACLPEAVTAALPLSQEIASALAAAGEYLAWEAPAQGAGVARILGDEALMEASDAGLSLILLEPGKALTLDAQELDGLYFALTGPSRWRSEGAALLALEAGQTLFVSAGHGLRITALDTPLLAAAITG